MDLVKAQIKARDNYTCQKCGKKVSGANCQASHVIPVSHGNALAFDPLNMKVMCQYCHKRFWHDNPMLSSEWFAQKFPERWQYLQERKQLKVHWKAHDYLEMIKQYEQV